MTSLADKTIFMPKAIWKKWEAGLKNPNICQAQETLFDGKGYCCLGVLQKVLDGGVERLDEKGVREILEENPGSRAKVGDSAQVPSKEWLRSHGIKFLHNGIESQVPEVYTGAERAVREKYGDMNIVSALNDEGSTFAEILELMRPHVELT